jgi:hypothetical protein
VSPMSDKVFGLSVNQVMADAAIANVMLVLVLTTIDVYYAWLAKRQADASSAQWTHQIGREKLPRKPSRSCANKLSSREPQTSQPWGCS